jgi:hypothetical protein
MRYLPNVLLVLSLPAGFIGYAVAARVLTAMLPGQAPEIVMLFVPLLVAGLCMLPFLIPFVDRKAKHDLAAIRTREALDPSTGEGPSKAD